MEITFQFSKNSASQPEIFAYAASNLHRHGVKTYMTSDHPKTQVMGCWGWRKGEWYRARGHEVLVFERGYLGDRFEWTSLAWNGLNGRGNFCLPEVIKPDRFEKNFKLQPWNKDGKYIVIMGQLKGDMSLAGLDLTPYYEKWEKQLKEKYSLPVFFRLHPADLKRNFFPSTPVIEGDLEKVLAGAFMVVTYNSNSGVDAVLAGKPALSFDIGSMAYEVTGHDINDRIFPDREAWAHKLAYCQWSKQEIANGDYWERMRCAVEI